MIVIPVTVITIRMNPIAFVVLRRVNVVGRTLVSILIEVVAKGNAMIVILMTTIIVSVPPGVALVGKRAGSYVRIVDTVDSLNFQLQIIKADEVSLPGCKVWLSFP